MNWTDERVEKLKKLWADGLSASQIAAQLGGVSRNAVIGKVHRLHLPGRAKSGGSGGARTKRAAAAPRAPSAGYSRSTSGRSSAPRSSGGASAAVKQDLSVEALREMDPRPVEDVVVPISRRLPLTELTEKTCKWPIGDPLNEDFHFCGNESPDGAPYCGYHAKLAFQPSSERRRAR